ncbi:hypothetical protein JVT61DRAFT_4667 [Boletus reticuloceps]|uniref:Mixed lineage kinase domain-containing protein n=1 Tax=Boletus reticuloceps TaxID=495285 RepID=A0A8I2YKI1_9AGAM|nr:hypothetical protein JVT61DRAFT_4667 [Boletus reticuloceps]
MPLRFIRSKVCAVDPLQVAVSATALAKDLLTTLQFPPAIAAVSIVLLMLETVQVSVMEKRVLTTVQNIQTNKAGCISLARRAAQILVDIDHQMRGRWDSAPERLVQSLQKFEGTLKLIHDFMKRLADSKWSDRFLRKNAIEDALAKYTMLLDDATQSFQLATLIDLHYTVGTLSRNNTESAKIQAVSQLQIEAPPPYMKGQTLELCVEEPENAESRVTRVVDVPEHLTSALDLSFSLQSEEPISEIATDGIQDSLNDQYLPEELSSLTLDNNHGFRRYHQSEVILRGRSCLKEGWWAGGMEVQVQGQPALIKRYDDPKTKASRQWLRDVKMLQNLYHPNLPQMFGFSDDETPTPFILLSNVKTQTPEATVREMLRTASLATCMELMLRFVSMFLDTAIYVQRQLNLTDSQVQDFFEAAGFRVDSQKTLVVGLPPPREGKWYSARNYGLAHTLLDVCLKMLPNQGRVTYSCDTCDEEVTEDIQKKVNHLVTLARSLLPSGSQQPLLPSKLQQLIEDNDSDTPSLTLRQVRDLTFHAGAHEHSWYERNVPACKFSVGDFGYTPRGKDWSSFVRLGNVLEDDAGALKLSFRANGEHWCWENVPIRRQPLQAFELPMTVSGWPVAVPPYKQIDIVVVHEAFSACVKDAWQYLLENGKKIAENAGIKPEDIVLVTHAGTHQDFYVKDFRPQPFGMNQNARDPRFADNPFHLRHTHGVHQPPRFGFPSNPHFAQPMMPSIVYLFTSLLPSHEPYWSSSPMCAMPGSDRPPLDRQFTYKIGR